MLECKGPMVLLKALAILYNRKVSFRALFVGPWRGSLAPEDFKRYVLENKLSEFVQHLGPVYGEAKVALLKSADLMAFPTHYENEAFPLVVLEGMAAGLVPITSNIAALPDIVEGVGICVPPRDAVALADALQSLIVDRKKMRRLQTLAREKYVNKFTQEHFERALVRVLVATAGVEKIPANNRKAETQT